MAKDIIMLEGMVNVIDVAYQHTLEHRKGKCGPSCRRLPKMTKMVISSIIKDSAWKQLATPQLIRGKATSRGGNNHRVVLLKAWHEKLLQALCHRHCETLLQACHRHHNQARLLSSYIAPVDAEAQIWMMILKEYQFHHLSE